MYVCMLDVYRNEDPIFLKNQIKVVMVKKMRIHTPGPRVSAKYFDGQTSQMKFCLVEFPAISVKPYLNVIIAKL